MSQKKSGILVYFFLFSFISIKVFLLVLMDLVWNFVGLYSPDSQQFQLVWG